LFVYEDVTDVAKYSSDVDMLHTNRLTDRYSEVFEYCRLFLDGISPDVFVGDRSCAAIMFDMNKVFEDYVSREMRKAARRAGFRLKKQGPTRFVVKRHATGENLFQMKPDLSLWNDSNEAAGIIDCKWKMLDSDKAKFAITQSDIYQMVAYGNWYDCGRLMLLYPAVAAFSGDVIKLQVIDDITTILVAGIDLAGIVGFGESIGQQIDVLVRALVEIEPAAPAQF
jgi:5-methylcytosine-specific restriction enzyme subunit McrC